MPTSLMRTTGINPVVTGFEYDDRFKIVNPLTNYAVSMQQYNQDTAMWGMLASYFGPNMRAAGAMPIGDLYGQFSGGDGQILKSGGGGVGVNVVVDWDLANKQAEMGTAAYYRKILNDMTPTNWGAYDFAQDVVASRNPNYAATLYHERTAEPNPAARVMAHNEALATFNLSGQYGNVKVTHTPSQPGWNLPNQDGFHGISTFSQMDRLAPTHISQGSGLFAGSRITQVNTGPSLYDLLGGQGVQNTAQYFQHQINTGRTASVPLFNTSGGINLNLSSNQLKAIYW